MSAKRKKHCPRCGVRVSRSAKKCGCCGRLLLGPGILSVIGFTALAMLLLLGRLLSFP